MVAVLRLGEEGAMAHGLDGEEDRIEGDGDGAEQPGLEW